MVVVVLVTDKWRRGVTHMVVGVQSNWVFLCVCEGGGSTCVWRSGITNRSRDPLISSKLGER